MGSAAHEQCSTWLDSHCVPRGTCRRAPAVRCAAHHLPWSGGGAGVTDLKDWHEWPKWQPQDLQARFPALEAAGVDLMRQMFVYDPAKRITVIRLPQLSTRPLSGLDSNITSVSCHRQTQDGGIAATSASPHLGVVCCGSRGTAAIHLLISPGFGASAMLPHLTQTPRQCAASELCPKHVWHRLRTRWRTRTLTTSTRPPLTCSRTSP